MCLHGQLTQSQQHIDQATGPPPTNHVLYIQAEVIIVTLGDELQLKLAFTP